MLQFELDFDRRLVRHKTGRPCKSTSWETADKQCKCGSRIRYTYKNLCVPCQRERAFKYSQKRTEKVKAGLALHWRKIKAERDESKTRYIITKIKQTSQKEHA